ncbi:MAG: outer membrane beta-barrel protein [Pseudomonadota bacterium]
MKKLATIAFISASVILSAKTYAIIPNNTGQPGFYVSGFGGISYLQDQFYAGDNIGNRVSYKLGFNGGGRVGYKRGPWETALDSLFVANGGKNNAPRLNAIEYMLTAVHSFDLGIRWVPYAGLGAGALTWLPRGNKNITTFAYKTILGVGYQFNPNLRLFFEFNHIATSAGSFGSGATKRRAYYQNNLGNIGFTYFFSKNY